MEAIYEKKEKTIDLTINYLKRFREKQDILLSKIDPKYERFSKAYMELRELERKLKDYMKRADRELAKLTRMGDEILEKYENIQE